MQHLSASKLFILAIFQICCSFNAFAHDPSTTPLQSTGLKVLVYSNTAYYRHPDIPRINRWLVLLGHEHGIEVDITEHEKDLMPKVLEKYDVLLLNNANELDKVIPEQQRASVEEWFSKGKKGIVGLHAALVHQTKWPWLNQLGGCDFNSDSDFLNAKVVVDPAAKDHPAVKGQKDEFWIEADWTNHSRAVTGLPGFHVLMRVDESSYVPVRDYFKTRGGKPMGKDHPIAWTHEPASGGRFFYTEFGHDLRSLSTPFVRQHIVEGIQWSAGNRFDKEIIAFEEADKTNPSASGGILFTGASGIRLWKSLEQDFPGLPVLNRGFGGSQLSDSIHFLDRITLRYQPRTIVIQAGGNDINSGKTPEQVLVDFKTYVEKTWAVLPDVKIVLLNIGPSPKRWGQRDKQQQANQLVRDYIDTGKNLVYVDFWADSLGADGLPKPELYVADMLHPSAKGYELRTKLLRPHLP